MGVTGTSGGRGGSGSGFEDRVGDAGSDGPPGPSSFLGPSSSGGTPSVRCEGDGMLGRAPSRASSDGSPTPAVGIDEGSGSGFADRLPSRTVSRWARPV